MPLYQKKLVCAVDFDELIELGKKAEGANIRNGAPWFFELWGCTFTHENDDLYLISSSDWSGIHFSRNDILIVVENGCIQVKNKRLFLLEYEQVYPKF